MNGSTECREERLLTQHQYQNEKIANEFADKRDQQTSININEKNVCNSNITDEIRKFHANVSRGPEYICSRCNHAVVV